MVGLEPTRPLRPYDFKSHAYANSATCPRKRNPEVHLHKPLTFVIPAKAGIQAVNLLLNNLFETWIPAFQTVSQFERSVIPAKAGIQVVNLPSKVLDSR